MTTLKCITNRSSIPRSLTSLETRNPLLDPQALSRNRRLESKEQRQLRFRTKIRLSSNYCSRIGVTKGKQDLSVYVQRAMFQKSIGKLCLTYLLSFKIQKVRKCTVTFEIIRPPLFHQFLKFLNFYNIKLKLYVP